jgi:hypothetical protein
LIATAKLDGVNPQADLADILARLADHPASGSVSSCPGIGTGLAIKPPPEAVAISGLAVCAGIPSALVSLTVCLLDQ